jgi:hypothetical protein
MSYFVQPIKDAKQTLYYEACYTGLLFTVVLDIFSSEAEADAFIEFLKKQATLQNSAWTAALQEAAKAAEALHGAAEAERRQWEGGTIDLIS